MRIITHPECLNHEVPQGHPERPDRLRALLDGLANAGLLAELEQREAAPIAPEQLQRIHHPELLAALDALRPAQGLAQVDPDTSLGPRSLLAAALAAGAVADAVHAVLAGETQRAFCAVRPPGHHAEADAAMGFCLYNSVALGTQLALDAGLERVAILDFDVHHGNGTQDVFYRDPSVLFVSLHQYPLYPMSGRLEETGAGPGLGFTCNLPLPPGAGDDSYRQAMERIVTPLAEQFRPDLILVSAGFDGHWQDPLSHMNLTLSGYDYLLRCLMALARTACAQRLVVALEGGYEPEVLRCAVHNTLQTLMGRAQFQDPFGASGVPDVAVDDALARAGALWGAQ